MRCVQLLLVILPLLGSLRQCPDVVFPFLLGGDSPSGVSYCPRRRANLVLPQKCLGETQWPEAGCGSVVNVPQHALPAPSQLASAAAALNQRELIPH